MTPTEENKIKRIKQRRKREAIFMAILDFFSVVATLVCVYSDALSLFGIALVLSGPMLGLGLTIGVIGISVIAGAFWARKKFKGYREDRKKESSLMEECFELENKNSMLGITPKELVKELEPVTFGEKSLKLLSKIGNRLMSFATGGFSTMLGMAGVLFGALSIAFTPAMPVAILALFVGIAVFSVAFGVASVIAEFYLSRSQGDHIEELREKKEELQKTGYEKTISNLHAQNELLNKKLAFNEKIPKKENNSQCTERNFPILKEEKECFNSIKEKNENISFFKNVKDVSDQEKSQLRHRVRSNSA